MEGTAATGTTYVEIAPASTNEALQALVSERARRNLLTPQYVQVTAEPGKATLSDLQWEWRAEQESREALSNTRAAGEKWVAALTSLTAVFSVIVLIKGPEDIGKVQGKVSDWLPEDDVLAGVIFLLLAAILFAAGWRVARQWNKIRGTLWAAATVSVVVSVPAFAQEFASWEAMVIAALGVAVALAGFAILAGARAAYGPVVPRAAASGSLLRTQDRRETRRSRLWLVAAIYAAVGAVVFIALAVGTTWIVTPDKPEGSTLVVRDGKPPICGELETKTKGALLVRRSGQEFPDEIPNGQVRSTQKRASCPGD